MGHRRGAEGVKIGAAQSPPNGEIARPWAVAKSPLSGHIFGREFQSDHEPQQLRDGRAELQFFRTALQAFYLNVASRAPEPVAMLREIQADVQGLIAKIPVEPHTAQGDQRMKAMVEGHCTAFFALLESHAQERLASRAGSDAAH